MLFRLFALFALLAVAFANPKPDPQVAVYGAGAYTAFPYYTAGAYPYYGTGYPYAYNPYFIR